MKLTRCLLCLLLCLALLCGCSAGLDDDKEPTRSTQAPTQQTTEPAPTQTTVPETTAPTEPEPTLPQAAVTTYSDMEFDGYVSVVPITNTVMAATTYEYDEEYEEAVHLYILDLSAGTATEPVKLSDGQYLSHHRIEGGAFLLEDGVQHCYLVMDAQLQTLRTITVPEMFGYFTADLSRYYYIKGDVLMVYDLESEASAPVEAAADLHISYITSVDSVTNVMLLAVYTDPYSHTTCNAAIDLDTGELLIMSSLGGYQSFGEGGVITEEYDPDTWVSDLYYYTYGSGQYRHVSGEQFMGEDSYLSTIPGTNYVIWHESWEGDFGDRATFLRMGDSLESCEAIIESIPGWWQGAVALHDGSLLCNSMDDAGKMHLTLIRPDQFEFTEMAQISVSDLAVVDPEVKDQYARILEGPSLPARLEDVRALADAIEEEFGVTILISNQCARPAEGCEFPMVTTDQVTWMDEAWYISDALHILRRTLELYPEGFFRQFRWEDSPNGILILLVEDIQSANNAIGVSYWMGNWYPVAVDITSYDLMTTYCHELWHATENFISDHDHNLFNSGGWEAMNPVGFEYSYDTTLGYIYDTEWTYFDGWYYNNSYFVDSYGRTNAKEDRARLMEYIMAHEEETRSMMEAPALNEKTEFMCRIIRKVFDTTGWENVWWERYHPDVAVE